MKFNQLVNLLLEKKDSLINKLDLSDDQKQTLIDFFNKHPNYEAKIDWNNKDLKWQDFESILSIESKTGKEKAVKTKGISGLKEGKDYLEAEVDPPFVGYIPLNHQASQLIASSKIGGCEGKWCTAANVPQAWNSYVIENGGVLIYLIGNDTKWAILIKENDLIEIYDSQDKVVKRIEGLDVEKLVRENKKVIEEARKITQKDAYLNKQLIKAAYEGHLEVVKEILKDGADVHAKDDQALLLAAENGHLEVVQELLKAGANANVADNIPLRWAAYRGHLEVIKELLKAGANVHAENDAALRYAIDNDHLEVVKELLKAGADTSKLSKDLQKKLKGNLKKKV